MSQAFLADDQMNTALNQFSVGLTQQVAASNAQAASNQFSLVTAARQFEMGGALAQAQLMARIAIDSSALTGWSNLMGNVQNAYMAGGSGGSQGGGTDWGAIGGGVGGLAGMGIGAATGGLPGAMIGGMAGSMFGGTAGYLGGS